MIEQLPCATCTALCCGPVAITRQRLKLIRDYLKNMPKAERKRLAKQKRGDLDCGFLDKATHRCSIYPVRPWVCEIFGRTEGLECPKVGHLVQIMPEFLIQRGFHQEGVGEWAAKQGMLECKGTEDAVGISNLWNWKKMDFDK